MDRLDHLVYATPKLDETLAWVEGAAGLRPAPGGQHLGVGTRNFLLSLGRGRYLEIIGRDSDQPEPAEPRPFGIDVLDRPRLMAWLAKSSDLESAAAAAALRGFDLGAIRDMSRTTPEGEVLRWRLTRRSMSDAAVVPMLIDWADTRHPSITAPTGVSLIAFRAQHPQPDQVREVLGALGLDLHVSEGPKPRLVAQLVGPAGEFELS